MVTNDMTNLPTMDNIILMEKGQIKTSGRIEEVRLDNAYLEFIRDARNIKLVDFKTVRDILDQYVNIEEAENLITGIEEQGHMKNNISEKKEQIMDIKNKIDDLIAIKSARRMSSNPKNKH